LKEDIAAKTLQIDNLKCLARKKDLDLSQEVILKNESESKVHDLKIETRRLHLSCVKKDHEIDQLKMELGKVDLLSGCNLSGGNREKLVLGNSSIVNENKENVEQVTVKEDQVTDEDIKGCNQM